MMKNLISTPVEIYGRTAENRILFQPMEGCNGTADGAVDELTLCRYLRFAEGAPGIIWFETTAVCNDGRANPRQLYISENTVGSFKDIVTRIKEKSMELHGFESIIIVQLTHSGRYSKPNGTPEPIIAYRNEVWEKGKENQPFVIASDEYLATIPAMYAKAAKLALEAGFDGMDVKCCHCYLFNGFIPGKHTICKVVSICFHTELTYNRFALSLTLAYPEGQCTCTTLSVINLSFTAGCGYSRLISYQPVMKLAVRQKLNTSAADTAQSYSARMSFCSCNLSHNVPLYNSG